jgi:hypothetical protein
VDRLKIVLTWTPENSPLAKPFEQLDSLYYGILSTAKIAYEAVDTHSERDFLLLFRAYHFSVTRGFIGPDSLQPYHISNEELNDYLQLERGAHETTISDLRSLVSICPGPSSGTQVRFYHQSFSDFLNEQARSKDLFVPESRVHTHLAKCFLQTVIQRSDNSAWAISSSQIHLN